MASRDIALADLAARGLVGPQAENYLTSAQLAGARIVRGVAITYSEQRGFRVRTRGSQRGNRAYRGGRGGDAA